MTEKEFILLRKIQQFPGITQRELVSESVSLGSVNRHMNNLVEKGLVAERRITPAGEKALLPHKVDNAVIMAAGMSSRFIPLSYDMPKGLITVKGEVLIERLIRQLKERGITEIYVVLGYMKDKFFYLEKKYGVTLVINNEYAAKNNPSSLMLVRENLRNTYIICSDLYFTQNIFDSYVYDSYYSTKMLTGVANEYGYSVDAAKRMIEFRTPSNSELVLAGEAYFSRAFSQKFARFLETEYDTPGVAGALWEELLHRHLDELAIYEKIYAEDVVYEFDSLQDLRNFDPDYIKYVHSPVLANICTTMNCQEKDILDIKELKIGLTNRTFVFSVKGKKYLYRQPGVGTERVLNRRCEKFAEENAKRLEIDNTYIYMDPEVGWKLSEFVENCVDIDETDSEQVKRAVGLLKKLHTAAIACPWDFDLLEQAEKYINDMHERGLRDKSEFSALHDAMCKLYAHTAQYSGEKVLCHNDAWYFNFLASEGSMQLIDWEYAGANYPMADFASIFTNSAYSHEQFLEVLAIYLGRECSEDEKNCFTAYNSLVSYQWYIWGIWKSALGSGVGDVLRLWHDRMHEYYDLAVKNYALV